VFVLVAKRADNCPANWSASAILGGKAWTTRGGHIPLALLPFSRRRLDRLQAMTLFGSPAILALPAGFTHDHKNLMPSSNPENSSCRAAAVPLLLLDHPVAAGTEVHPGRRGFSVVAANYGAPRRVEMKKCRGPLAFCLWCAQSLFLPYFAL